MQIVPVTNQNKAGFAGMLIEPTEPEQGTRVRFGITENEDNIGSVVADEDGDLISVESLYIRPEYRRRGLASAALEELARRGKEQDRRFLTAEFLHSRTDLEDFFLSNDFVLTEGDPVYGFLQNRVIHNKVADSKIPYKVKGNCKMLGNLSAGEKEALKKRLCRMGFPEDLLSSRPFHKSLSCCVFNDSGNVDAVMLCSEFGDNIVIELIAGGGTQKTAILSAFRHFLNALKERGSRGKIPEDAMVYFQAQRDNVVRTGEKIFGGNMPYSDFMVFAFRSLKEE